MEGIHQFDIILYHSLAEACSSAIIDGTNMQNTKLGEFLPLQRYVLVKTPVLDLRRPCRPQNTLINTMVKTTLINTMVKTASGQQVICVVIEMAAAAICSEEHPFLKYYKWMHHDEPIPELPKMEGGYPDGFLDGDDIHSGNELDSEVSSDDTEDSNADLFL
jgi:hypothetical protein